MTGRLSVACVSLLAVVAFLLLFASASHVEAVTFKAWYGATLSCVGTDGQLGTADDSCTPDPTYGAYGAGLTADMIGHFEIPWDGVAAKYSNFGELRTGGIPANWYLATDKEIPNGALMGNMTAISTLGLITSYEGECKVTMPVVIPMYDCTTDNFEGVNDGCPAVDTGEKGTGPAPTPHWCNDNQDNDGDTKVNDGCPAVGAAETAGQCDNDTDDDGDGDPMVEWDGDIDGANLTFGHYSGLPAGCNRYPQHVNIMMEGLRPRARYFGFTIVIPGMNPTQLQFLLFSTEELTALGALPESDMGENMGYLNRIILDNPEIPAGPGGTLTEFCTPLSTDTNLHGHTDGEGHIDVTGGAWSIDDIDELAAGSFWTVPDPCNNTTDDDADTTVNELCSIPRVRNPEAGTGIYDTGSHPTYTYAESYRDTDGDTIPNNEDECVIQVDSGTDTDGDFIDDICDPSANPGDYDEDNDGWRNQADNCPLTAQTDQDDEDDDAIGDDCDNDNWDPISDGAGNARDRIRGLNPLAPGEDTLTDKCNDNVDDDADTVWDDNCLLDPDFANGRYLNDMPISSICIGEADADGDGWCDSTENLAAIDSDADQTNGNPGERRFLDSNGDDIDDCEDALDNDGDTYADTVDAGVCVPGGPDTYPAAGYGCDAGCSTPEYYGIDFTLDAADDPPGAAPVTCTNYDYYDVNQSHPATPHQTGAGNPVDDDGDTVVNDSGGSPDPGCTCPGDDADCDGVADASDNCPNDPNPTQLNTDYNDGKDTTGDACDIDDDNDKTKDIDEWAQGSDPKNVCDPVSFDLNQGPGEKGVINIMDVLVFSNKIFDMSCNPPADYRICEPVYRHVDPPSPPAP